MLLSHLLTFCVTRWKTFTYDYELQDNKLILMWRALFHCLHPYHWLYSIQLIYSVTYVMSVVLWVIYGMTKSQIYFESEKEILEWKLVTETHDLSLQDILNG